MAALRASRRSLRKSWIRCIPMSCIVSCLRSLILFSMEDLKRLWTQTPSNNMIIMDNDNSISVTPKALAGGFLLLFSYKITSFTKYILI